MKKIYFLLTLMSTLRNQFGSYAYRVEGAFADADGKEPLDIDDLGIQNIREYDDEFTLFDRAKLCATGKQVKAVGIIRVRNGVNYVNLEDKASLRKAIALDERKDDIEDAVAVIAHAEKAARRFKMSDRGLDVVVGNLSTSMFAGVNVNAAPARVRTIDNAPAKDQPKGFEEPKEDNEEPKEGNDVKELKMKELQAQLEKAIAEKADESVIEALELELAELIG